MIQLKEENYLTMEEAAAKLNVARRTLQVWHTKKVGPPRVRVGGRSRGTIYYGESDLLKWMQEQTSEEGA